MMEGGGRRAEDRGRVGKEDWGLGIGYWGLGSGLLTLRPQRSERGGEDALTSGSAGLRVEYLLTM